MVGAGATYTYMHIRACLCGIVFVAFNFLAQIYCCEAFGPGQFRADLALFNVRQEQPLRVLHTEHLPLRAHAYCVLLLVTKGRPLLIRHQDNVEVVAGEVHNLRRKNKCAR